MKKCKYCGKEYPFRGSCSEGINYEFNYCDNICWKKSDEYKKNKESFLNFRKSLNEEQLAYFDKLVDDFDTDYEYIYGVWIDEIKKVNK